MTPVVYMVVPCYNEEPVLPETAQRLREKYTELISAGRISEKSRICFVDDGSKDRTWKLIQELHGTNRLFSSDPERISNSIWLFIHTRPSCLTYTFYK